MTIETDIQETQEWIDALSSLVEYEGVEKAQAVIQQLSEHAANLGVNAGATLETPYKNTISVSAQPEYPGNVEIEKKILSLLRWNSIAIVVRAVRKNSGIGGHIATYASAAALYEVGFNHFFHAPTESHGGDLVYIQGHSSPGIYARSFLEGRLTEENLDYFRQEVSGKGKGLSSYPHPWLMPDYWQFATVSMGLGPIQAIYQARFLNYLHNRKFISAAGRKVWAFLGDGETDEPESLGAISLAGRENLDNLIFVINCNLQRLDGPVRGNAKIIQELESMFRGARWNVIKVIWGQQWDELFAKDKKGLILKRLDQCVDGEFQAYKAHDGAYIREKFFGASPELLALVADKTDSELWHLSRGGHDLQKVYTAYAAATKHKGQPTVILAKTVKGYGMGDAGEAQNITHQKKKMSNEDLATFAKRFHLPISAEEAGELPYLKADEETLQYMQQRRQALGGYLPARRASSTALHVPALDDLAAHLKGSDGREISSTMAFVRVLSQLLKDKEIGRRLVPIVPDESRTFGMEGLFRQIGIYSPHGQLYTPEDKSQLMYYKEATDGQIFEEGLTEAGAMCTWISAGTAYSHSDCPMIPFYVYYSMFGFQRTGDLAWAAGDMQARGFLIGAVAGRTTLEGEGLQHNDGHQLNYAATIPNCISYDPTYAYEIAVIIQEGLRRMYQEQESIYYYITIMNENYAHPPMPEGAVQGILKGMYLLKPSAAKSDLQVQLLGSGTILREVEAAAELLQKDFNVSADVWSATSFIELSREGLDVERHNMLHPSDKPKQSYVEVCLQSKGPVVAATDYMKSYADQIRQFIPQQYVVLGTDGYGRSETREAAREHFEVNRYYVVVAALHALVKEGKLAASEVEKALKLYNIEADKPNPAYV